MSVISLMHFLIPFMSLMAGPMAADNIFAFEDSSPIVDFDTETLSPDSNWEISFHELFTDEPPEESLYPEDPGYGEEWLDDEHTSPVSSDGVADACSLEPSAVSKKRRSRRSECKVQDWAEYGSPEFYDLDLDVQEQVYKKFGCPSSKPGEAFVPVCSSRLTENNFLEHTSYYTLLDSFLCTYLPRFGP